VSLHTAQSRGFAISYEDVGAGPPVVLVNGYASPAAEWTDVGYVDRLLDAGYRVLAVDSLGHGLSDTPHDWETYLPPAIAGDIVAAMDAAEVSAPALWGFSRGAGLVAMAAAEFPDRVAALVAGGLTWVGETDEDHEISPSTEALQRGDWDAFWDLLGMPVSEADRRPMQDSSDPKALAAAQIGRQRSTYELDAHRIKAPSLLYYGAAETDAVREATEAFGVEPHILAGEHDHIQAFTDVESAAPIVLEFLARVYPSAG
jgi:pimeloyl-ACP methyl ester carboxylesterase